MYEAGLDFGEGKESNDGDAKRQIYLETCVGTNLIFLRAEMMGLRARHEACEHCRPSSCD